MKWTQTWYLLALAGALAAFIFFFEQHLVETGATAPPEKVLPQFKAAGVTGLQLRRGKQFVLHLERAGESWNVTNPLAYPAAPVAVESLLQSLEQLVPQTRISPEELGRRKHSPDEFGFDAPQAVLTLVAGGSRHELQIGARTAAGDRVYLQVVGRPGIYVVEAGLIDRLPRTLNDWRETALLNLAGWNFDRVETIKTGGGLALQREATTRLWQLSRPQQRADQAKVEALFEKIRQARVLDFVTDDPKADLEAFGLQPPALELLFGQGTNHLQRVQFGRSPTNDPASVYARRLSQTNIVLVPKTLLETLHTPFTELRDRRLVAFDPAAVDLIDVRGAEPFTLRRQTNHTWTTGDNLPADVPYMRDLLVLLSQFEITEYVKDVVTDFSSYGLKPPPLQYVLKAAVTNAGGPTNVVLAQLDFGTNLNDQVFVRRADEDSVYAVRQLDFHYLPAAAWQLRDHRVWNFTTNQVVRVTVRQHGQTRVLVRAAGGDWSLAPGSPGTVNPWAMEEMMFRLGDMHAMTWVARGAEGRARHGFTGTGHTISIEIKVGDKFQTLTMDFGGSSLLRLPYASTLVDGQPWVFEFPWQLYPEILRELSIPPQK